MNIDDVAKDSTEWGNYQYNSELNFTGKYYYEGQWTDTTTSTLKPINTKYTLGTGVSENTRRNNIYDLAGNCSEWTTEANSSGNVVGRGGHYDGANGGSNPASYRYNFTASSVDPNHSFRVTLYINAN